MADATVLVERETVRTQEGLNRLAVDLKAAGRFALDTEFAGERTYVPRLCLVQVATSQFIALVDTLAIPDLTPLWDLVGDRSVEKVLHAAREDLRLAYYGGGRLIPRGIIDNQVAAGLIGLSQFPLSYGRLVEALHGIRLPKTETRSDWERRPLSPDQVRYARDDVRYLLPVADRLGRMLEKLGRSDWLTEEMVRFSEPLVYEPDPDEAYLRVRGPRAGLTARPTAILRALAAWREREAAARNVPSRTILRDEVLTDIALRAPKRLTDIIKIKNFPLGEEVTLGPDILAAVEHAKALPEESLPLPLIGQEEDTPQHRVIIDLVTALGAALCMARNVAPELAMTKSAVGDLVRGTNGTSALLAGWRRDAIGADLERFVIGSAHAQVHIAGGEAKVSIGGNDGPVLNID